MVSPEVEVGGRDGPDTPLCLGGECLPLVVGRGGHNDLVSVLIDGPCGGGRDLTLLLGLLLYLCNLCACVCAHAVYVCM